MEWFFLFLLLPCLIYWCINEKTGLQLGIVFLLSIWVVFLHRHLYEYLPLNFDIRWILVAVIFCSYLLLRNKIEAFLARGGFRAYMIASAAASFVMILYRPSAELIIPGGIMIGLGAGYCLNKRYIDFKSINILQRNSMAKYFTLLARFVLGLAVLLLIVFTAEKIIERMAESQNIDLYIFLCYAISGFWVSAGAPWVFVKFSLADTFSANAASPADAKSPAADEPPTEASGAQE